jgi:hypothetical protein
VQQREIVVLHPVHEVLSGCLVICQLEREERADDGKHRKPLHEATSNETRRTILANRWH